jgi:hypothetical protein
MSTLRRAIETVDQFLVYFTLSQNIRRAKCRLRCMVLQEPGPGPVRDKARTMPSKGFARHVYVVSIYGVIS